jgi:hypothetical protein
MKPDSRTPRDKVRLDNQPHSTTESQINEMESEGQGGASKERTNPRARLRLVVGRRRPAVPARG